jgi:hypothetical protein
MNESAPQASLLADKLADLMAGEFGEITADALRSTFDHWRVFESGGRWWAFRSGEAADSGPRSLIQPVVSAMTLEGLAEQLSLQEWLRRMSAAELNAVWREGIAAWCAGNAAVTR